MNGFSIAENIMIVVMSKPAVKELVLK